jgi:hypothetical protein
VHLDTNLAAHECRSASSFFSIAETCQKFKIRVKIAQLYLDARQNCMVKYAQKPSFPRLAIPQGLLDTWQSGENNELKLFRVRNAQFRLFQCLSNLPTCAVAIFDFHHIESTAAAHQQYQDQPGFLFYKNISTRTEML